MGERGVILGELGVLFETLFFSEPYPGWVLFNLSRGEVGCDEMPMSPGDPRCRGEAGIRFPASPKARRVVVILGVL